MQNTTYDIIIIGTGAGGGTLLHTLKDSGLNILVLERGQYLPREKANWNTVDVFQHDRYHNAEKWRDDRGNEFQPGAGYWVGGNTKVYGAALFRLRERDFEKVEHAGGFSPEWPLKYKDLEPYYTKAERLYEVRGKAGLDPTEGFRSEAYGFAPVSHEPVIQALHDRLELDGLHPFYIPLGIKLDEKNMLDSACIRCDTCDGFPCMMHAKADADINCVRPALRSSKITLLTGARATRLLTNTAGTSITSVEVEIDGQRTYFKGDIIVSSCGAINSAALLLSSDTAEHPKGLANSSGLVGRNFMKHQNAAILAIGKRINTSVFQKTMAINDFYWGDKDFSFPMGCIQLMGKSNKDMLASDAPKFAPGLVLDTMAQHSIDWWLTGEDLPDTDNRVEMVNGQITLRYHENNTTGFDRMMAKWKHILNESDIADTVLDHKLYLGKKIPIAGVAHQVGTLKFGTDPKTSVLDIHCRTHDLDNLFVVDGSFFPSSGAVNPSLTIMANAIRVGEYMIDYLKKGK